MANMKKTNLHHVLHTKAQEDEFKRLNHVPNPQDLIEEVEIRDEPLQVLELFPWKMIKVLEQSDLEYPPGLELSRQFVHQHLFKNWDERSLMHAWVHQRSIAVRMRDIDTKTDHEVTFQKCFNSDKYCLRGGWTRDFVQRRGLIVGMQIGMYWDARTSSIYFSVLKDAPDSPGSSEAAGSSKGRPDFDLSLK